MKKYDSLDIIIPVSIGDSAADAQSIADSINAQYTSYGFTRFGLYMPEKGWRSISYPPREYFEEKAELFLEIRKRLPAEISCGWWHTLVLKSGPTPGYTRIVRLNGTEAPFSTCPLDPAYRKRFAEDVAFVLDKVHPDFFVTEDDFGINCHGGRGCFCKHHLEEFARREGRSYSREELEELFTQHPAESRELMRRWQMLSRDSLALFAQTIREEADKLTPEIPMGIMQPGSNNQDGNAIEAVARAIAGKNHVPFVRFYGAFYNGERIADIPQALFHAIYSKEHIRGEFRFYHESDPYPHSRFYTSGSCMRAMMGAIYSCGYDGSVFQSQLPSEENAYGNMFKKERRRFNALRQSVRNCKLRGVQIYYDPLESSFLPGNESCWLKAVAAFGIPFTTAESSIVFFSGEQMRFMSDEKIREYLSRQIILDGAAAKVLTEMGYEKYLGARTTDPLIQGNDRFDLGGREIIAEDFLKGSLNRTMHRADAYSPTGNGILYKVEITDPACKEVTSVVNSRYGYMAPGMSIFKNSLGGQVIIYAASVENNNCCSLFNYCRQALFRELLCRSGAEFPMVKEAPKVFLINNVPEDEKEFSAVLTLINLAVDPIEDLSLCLPEYLRKKDDLAFLDREGSWQKIAFDRTADGVTLKHTFNYADPVYIMIR